MWSSLSRCDKLSSGSSYCSPPKSSSATGIPSNYPNSNSVGAAKGFVNLSPVLMLALSELACFDLTLSYPRCYYKSSNC